jgi:hypothetical protein
MRLSRGRHRTRRTSREPRVLLDTADTPEAALPLIRVYASTLVTMRLTSEFGVRAQPIADRSPVGIYRRPRRRHPR